ncbi:subtilisin-like protein [Ascobolus immersus RN42]|uniref:Subtilisin-like protein n=1 Tax=Ascobolus immersus RN42 TaxID=1160509 RepID=A0A3N4I5B9_ASCIM|nr:subtilisin-like protein [Ascobolus immersus RN42]
MAVAFQPVSGFDFERLLSLSCIILTCLVIRPIAINQSRGRPSGFITFCIMSLSLHCWVISGFQTAAQQATTASSGIMVNALDTCPSAPQLYYDALLKVTRIGSLHQAGLAGEGISITVIDSGLDAEHSGLGGKVVTSWDCYIDGPLMMHPNIMTHGMQVVGIIGGDGTVVKGLAAKSELMFVGVRDASLRKAADEEDKIKEMDALFCALEKSILNEQDFVSLSRGLPWGWSDGHPLFALFELAFQSGTLIFQGAGNDGLLGIASNFLGTTSPYSLSVGNYDQGIEPAFPGVLSARGLTDRKIKYRKAALVPEVQTFFIKPLYKALEQPDGSISYDLMDVCKLDISLVAPLSRSSILLLVDWKLGPEDPRCFSNIHAIIKKGYAGCVLRGTDLPNGYIFMEQFGDNWVGTLSDTSDYEFILKACPGGGQLCRTTQLVTEPLVAETIEAFKSAPMLFPESSRGPSWDLHFGVDVLGPGQNILTLSGSGENGYSVMSGTSAAVPAGVAGAALLKSSLDKNLRSSDPKTMRSLLITTANPIQATQSIECPHNDLKEDPFTQGGGVFDFLKASKSQVRIEPSQIYLNDSVHFKADWELLIQNVGDKDIQLRALHEPAAGRYVFERLPSFLNKPCPDPLLRTTVTFDDGVPDEPKSILLTAKHSVKLRLRFTKPLNFESKRLPLFSGYILFEALWFRT